MQKCNHCGADLPENSSFCGNCGSVQNALATDAGATRSNTPQPPSWVPEGGTILASWPPSSNSSTKGSVPAWSSTVQAPTTPLPPARVENEEEQRRGAPSWFPLSDVALGAEALLGSGQASPPGAPSVQGTPQISSVPSVAGSPTPYTNTLVSHPTLGAGNAAPVSPSAQGVANVPVSHPVQGPANAPFGNPTQGPANAPVSHPVQGPGNMPISHSVQGPVNAPVSHPVQGPVNVPVSHPVPRPQPRPEPPEEPGTHQPHPPHGPQRHHPHPEQPEPNRHHDHRTQHESHRVGKAKVAGGSTVKTILIVVTAVVVVAAGGIGAAAHFLSRPQPLINISSNYKVGNTPAGANGTILHISGQNFSSNSAITFLLDGHVAPGNPNTLSDSNGNFSANVTITSAWSPGTHTLTARDASNYSPQNSVSVTIVQPGQANTPGPNGAPPDDASFTLKVTAEPDIANPFSSNPVLIITGHPDPEGGTVCSPDDNGQSFTQNDTTPNTGMPFTRVETATCSGTYKAGQISYTETDTSVKVSSQSNGVNVTCVLPNPTVDLRLTGAYVGNNTFRGTINSPYFAYTCDQQGWSWWHEASQGVTWTGTIVTQ